MNLNSIVFSIVVVNVIGVNCGCEDYVTCVSDFLQSFFIKNNENVILKVNNTNNNVTELNNPKLSELDQVLKRLSNLLNGEIEQNVKLETGPTVLKHVDSDTKIFVKSFSFNEDVEEYPLDDTENLKFNSKGLDDTEFVRILPEKTSQDEYNNTLMSIKTNSFSDIFAKSLHSVKENEILTDDGLDIIYYEDSEDNSTDYPIIDYVDLYKDTTNEDNIYIPTDTPTTINALSNDIRKQNKDISDLVEYSSDMVGDFQNDTRSNLNEETSERADFIKVVPWIVTIFVKNVSKDNQFDYVCDGALLSDKTILTAARCVNFSNTLLDAEDLLVVLGKNSLQEMGESEIVNKIVQIIMHDNFTQANGMANNDLAILVMEEPVILRHSIQASNVTTEKDFSEDKFKSATTAWAVTGQLEPVFFEEVENGTCTKKIHVNDALCATYGLMVPLCPSYGGLFVVKQADDQWYLQGIMSGDPSRRGICIKKSVTYTSLRNHLEWIDDIVDSYK